MLFVRVNKCMCAARHFFFSTDHQFVCFLLLLLNEYEIDTLVDNPQCFQACYNMFNVKLSMHASKSKERRGERKGGKEE